MFISRFLRGRYLGRGSNRITPDQPPPPPPVYVAPSVPSGLTQISALVTSVSFSWTASTSNDSLNVLGYRVYQWGALVAEQTALSFTHTGLTASTAYSYTVSAYTLEKESAQSTPLVLTTTADQTPSGFLFTAQNGVAVNTPIESNLVTISGVSAPVAVSVSGGEYSKNGGSYTSTQGSITNGDSLRLRITSSTQALTGLSMSVTVGTVTRFFGVTTGTGDSIPDEFFFTNQTGVAVSTEITSAPVTITGIDVATPVSVSGGTWQKNGAGFFSTADGTVVVNDTIAVRHSSSASENTGTTTTLTVGGVGGTFTSVTVVGGGDDISPTPFTIPWQTGLAQNTVHPYGPQAIGGISVPVTVSVASNALTEWSKNGTTWSSASGTISNGENFYIRATTSIGQSSPVVTGATIGTLYVQYVLITGSTAQDTTPDAFAFVDQTGVTTGSTATSAAVPITGLTDPSVVTVTNGEWRQSAPVTTAWSSASGFIRNGESVQVRHTAAATPLTGTTTTLTVGGISGTFTSTTAADITAPSVPVLTAVLQGSDQANLSWSASTDAVGVTGYTVYDSVTPIYTGPLLFTTQTNIPANTTKTYTVKAFDAAGNFSAASNTQTVTTPPLVLYNRTLTGFAPIEAFTWAAPATGGYSAPSAVAISGVSGAITNGNTITISGSNFGNGNGTPLLWEDFESGTVGATLNASPTTGSWLEPSGNTYDAVYSTSSPYTGTKCSLASIPGNGWSNFRGVHDLSRDSMVSFRYRWSFSSAPTVGQLKLFIFRGSTNDFPLVETLSKDYAGNWWVSAYETETGSFNETSWPPPVSLIQANVWHRLDFWGRQSSVGGAADGRITIVIDGVQIYNLQNIVTRASSSQSWATLDFMRGFTNFDRPSTNSLDCCYMSNTWARVLVSDSPTFSATMHSEICPATTWSSGTVACKLNRGNFANFDNLYLYVVDHNGVANVSGWNLVP